MSEAPMFTKADLQHFTGTESWYRHAFVREVLFTDGAKFVADRAGAYWLIDEIAFAQRVKKVACEEFQVWKLTVSPNRTAVLSCEDGNGNSVFSKKVSFTDFPLDEIVFFFTNKTLLLPSEN